MSCIFQRWPMIISKRNNRSVQVSLPQWQPLHFQRQLHCYPHRQGWLQVLMLNLDLMFVVVRNKSKGVSYLVDMQNNQDASKRQMLIWSYVGTSGWQKGFLPLRNSSEGDFFYKPQLVIIVMIIIFEIVLRRYHDNYHLQTMIGDYPDI